MASNHAYMRSFKHQLPATAAKAAWHRRAVLNRVVALFIPEMRIALKSPI